MPSLLPGYEYDIFISYRQNDNRSGWVRQFVEDLREELGATLKDPVNIYFDENPHDGLQDTHLVDESLKGKLKCLIFIPVLSRTYCDPKGFAWNHEFTPFCRMAKEDALGMVVRLPNGNAASRMLPVVIHDLPPADRQKFEAQSGSVLRGVDFVFRSAGINRPLNPADTRGENLSKTIYRDQVNRTANAIDELVSALSKPDEVIVQNIQSQSPAQQSRHSPIEVLQEVKRRNVLRAGIVYIATALLIYLLVKRYVEAPERILPFLGILLVAGLALALTLAWLFERSPLGWIRTDSSESGLNPYAPKQRKPFTSIWVVAPMAVLIGYILYSEGPSPAVPTDKSIAVLPFENRGPNPADNYLSEGFGEDIVSRLYLIGGFRVISTASSRTYKDTQKTVKEIAGELGVTSILTGSVVRAGTILKVTAALHDGSNNEVIWSESYERTSTDILKVQVEIARRIADVLNVRLDEFLTAKLNHTLTRNLTAYDHLLKGRNLYNYSNADSMDLAIHYYKKALVLDPNYPDAYAGLADAYIQLQARFARGVQWIDSAIVASRKSVQLDSGLSDGYKALGAAHNTAKRYDSAFIYFQKAIEKNENNAQALGNLGSVYFLQLKYPEALWYYRRSSILNPNHPVVYQTMGWIYRLIGDYPRAEKYLKVSLEKRPLWDTYRELAFVYLARGENDEALKLIDPILELGSKGTRPLEIAGRIAHFAGDRVRAKAYFQEAIEKNPKYQSDPGSLSAIALGQILFEEGETIKGELYLSQAKELYLAEIAKGSQDDDPPFNVAAIFAVLGNRDSSLQYLKKAVEMRWIDYIQVEKGPYFARYRTDPGFMQIVAEVKKKAADIREQTEQTTAYAAPL
ncbi:MAG: hypothetical protein JNN04_01695 [Cyclobacteriaceae bacterium]|nr:hypothetical protein [Cyclobacteriaceae bacterium]